MFYTLHIEQYLCLVKFSLIRNAKALMIQHVPVRAETITRISRIRLTQVVVITIDILYPSSICTGSPSVLGSHLRRNVLRASHSWKKSASPVLTCCTFPSHSTRSLPRSSCQSLTVNSSEWCCRVWSIGFISLIALLLFSSTSISHAPCYLGRRAWSCHWNTSTASHRQRSVRYSFFLHLLLATLESFLWRALSSSWYQFHPYNVW